MGGSRERCEVRSGQFCGSAGSQWLQIDGTNDQVMPVGDPCAKFAAFGFETVKVDGHDIQAIVDAIQAPVTPGKPRFICCETVKGKGVPLWKRGRLARQGTQ